MAIFKKLLILGAFFGGGLGAALTGFAGDPQAFQRAMMTRPNSAESTIFLIDVREPSEARETGIAKDARLIPKSDIDANGPLWQQLLKDLELAKKSGAPKVGLYCRSGRRSGLVAEKLEKLGYKPENLGGFSDWQAAKLPTVPYSN